MVTAEGDRPKVFLMCEPSDEKGVVRANEEAHRLVELEFAIRACGKFNMHNES